MTIAELRIRACERITDPRTRQAIIAAFDVVEQARNVSPTMCGASMVLGAKLKAFDAALAGESK